jgi:ATP-dependent Clp protease protease subunit
MPDLHPAQIKKLDLEADKLALDISIAKLEEKAAALELKAKKMELSEREHVYQAKAAHADRHGRFFFFGAVNGGTVEECITELNWWHRQDTGKPFEIILNSPGGDVLHGLALYDDLIALRDQGHHITITVRGMAASMGGILLQAGDKRIVGKNSHVLIHEISTGAVGKLSEIEDEAAFCEKLSKQLLEILAERSTLTPAQIKRKWRKTDWWITADEAIEYGFADEIG